MAEATRRRAAGGLVVVCAAQFVTGVDGLFVAGSPVVGLASATGPFQWVLTAFGLGFGGLLLLGGRLGDLYGRRPCWCSASRRRSAS